MASNPVSPTWFAVAVQALVRLAQSDGVCPSSILAGQVNIHAVFLRRVLAELVRAQIVDAREGRDGGYRLARPAAEITLADVYLAVRVCGPIDTSHLEGETSCQSTQGFRQAFGEIVAQSEEQVMRVLGSHTIEGLIARVGALAHP